MRCCSNLHAKNLLLSFAFKYEKLFKMLKQNEMKCSICVTALQKKSKIKHLSLLQKRSLASKTFAHIRSLWQECRENKDRHTIFTLVKLEEYSSFFLFLLGPNCFGTTKKNGCIKIRYHLKYSEKRALPALS